jgi:hypothetical protein
VVNPNKIPAETPPTRRKIAILYLNGILFIKYHVSIIISVIATNKPITIAHPPLCLKL